MTVGYEQIIKGRWVAIIYLPESILANQRPIIVSTIDLICHLQNLVSVYKKPLLFWRQVDDCIWESMMVLGYVSIKFILIFNMMKNQEFELKLLIKQNTQMAIRLQSYRRQNQELTLKNSDLNCWVQNLSEVFASISAAWKIITDNEEALYTLMRRKTDQTSKQMVAKYINHFKAFDQIIMNLGDKITNEGHSDKATIEAKSRLSAFVSNYNLFFLEFVESYFKFNEECISFNSEMLKENNLHVQFKQIASQSIQNRERIKEFEEFMAGMSQNYKLYESYNQHKLLDGIIVQKDQQIEQLKDKNNKQARRISFMTDYSTRNISAILEHDETFQCYCGGAPLEYYNKVWEQSIKKEGTALDKKKSSHAAEQSDEVLREKIKALSQLELEKQLLMQRNVQILAKCQKIKQQNKQTDDLVLQSPLYLHLRNQFKDLMDYTSDLSMKLNKSYEYLNQLEKARLEEIEDLKKKYERIPSSHRHHSEHVVNIDHGFLQNFKDKIQGHCSEIKNVYAGIHKGLTDKEENLQRNKDSLKFLKKENEDLNRRLGQLQERQAKSVENLQFRHQKFNELEKAMNELMKNCPKSEEFEKTKKSWEELLQYTKTRDKKIKAMEEMIKKKDKEIVQKQKVEEVLKSSMSETEQIYQKYKEKLASFQQYMKNMDKQIQNLSQQNYKVKMEAEQEKSLLTIRLKNELDVKAKLEEKAKNYDRLEQQVKSTRDLAQNFEKKLQEYQTTQKEKTNQLRVDLKQKERIIGQLNSTIEDKQKLIEKLLQDKEKKNVEMNKMHLKMTSNSQYEVLTMQLEEYKSKILCRCGAERQRQVVLKTCPHIFCKKCIDDTTANRNRKCPICGIRFTKTDIHEIVWT